MLTIPADIVLEKNKLFASDAFVELLEWQISETSATVRVANYNEDISWNGYTWTKFRFEGGGEHDSGGDSAETVIVRVSAVDKVIQGHLETLTAGGIGDTVIYRRVHTSDLDLAATITATFEIVDIDAGPASEWVVFRLGQENFFLSQFPGNVFRRDVCRYRPSMTAVCAYVNNSDCKRTFSNCVSLGQESVFGGQPAIPGGAFYLPLLTYRGGITAASTLSGVLTRTKRNIIGSLSASSVMTGGLTLAAYETKALAGSILAVSSFSIGTPERLRNVSGSSSISLTTIASPLNRFKLFSGSFATAAAITGNLTKTPGATKSLSGAIATTSSVSAEALKRAKNIFGSLSASSTATTMPIDRNRSVIGSFAVVADFTADLEFTPYQGKPLVGIDVTAVSSVSGGVLKRLRSIQSDINTISAVTGTLTTDSTLFDIEDTGGTPIEDTGGTQIEDTGG